jgi:hypothetical protein
MFNVKWGIFPAAAAFVLAFILSLLFGQVDLFRAFLRALMFAAIFFALGIGVWFLVNTFIPELLMPDVQADVVANIFGTETPGSRVNITVGDTKDAALPNGGGIDEVENIANITTGAASLPDRFKWPDSTGDIDQKPSNGYTGVLEEIPPMDGAKTESEFGEFFTSFDSFSPEAAAGDAFSFADSGSADSGSAGGNADSDSGGTRGGGDFFSQADESPPERRVSSNKAQKLDGDFNPKEIAAGIRTVLEKDKKG